MVSTALELKNAAIKAHADLVVRVKGAQGGVATFFDNFFGQLLYRLMTTEATARLAGAARNAVRQRTFASCFRAALAQPIPGSARHGAICVLQRTS